LGVEGHLPAQLTLRLTGFYQWLYVSDMRSTFSHDVTTPDFLQMRRGRGYGAEVLLRLPDRGRVRGWLAYTLSWSTREFDGVFAPSDWDQRHILNLLAAVRLGRGYSVGGRFHYNTGRPYPIDGEYVRLPAFWQIDLRADKRFVFDRSTWDIYLELGNATFNRQVTAYGAVLDANASSRLYQPVGFRIVLPSMRVPPAMCRSACTPSGDGLGQADKATTMPPQTNGAPRAREQELFHVVLPIRPI
jgi:hypothetical protein